MRLAKPGDEEPVRKVDEIGTSIVSVLTLDDNDDDAGVVACVEWEMTVAEVGELGK